MDVFVSQEGVRVILEVLLSSHFYFSSSFSRSWEMTLFVFLAILCLGVATAAPSSDHSLDSEWQEWKIKYGKNYSLVSNIKTVQSGPTENGPCCWGLWVRQRPERPPQQLPEAVHRERKVTRISVLRCLENGFRCSVPRSVSWPLVTAGSESPWSACVAVWSERNVIHYVYFQEEEGQRRTVWEENKKMVLQHNMEYNQGKKGFTMEMNAFGDMVTVICIALHCGFCWFVILFFYFNSLCEVLCFLMIYVLFREDWWRIQENDDWYSSSDS